MSAGECDLVLLTDPTFGHGAGLDVHVRTTIRYDYSFIETASLRIGDDTLELSSWGVAFFNGVYLTETDIPPTFHGYPFSLTSRDEKRHQFAIQVDDNQNITMDTFKDFVNVELNLFPLLHSAGMMGDPRSGALLARDGVTVFGEEDLNGFGQEWQVLPTDPSLFQTIRAPQAPEEKCRLPDANKAASRSRRLG